MANKKSWNDLKKEVRAEGGNNDSYGKQFYNDIKHGVKDPAFWDTVGPAITGGVASPALRIAGAAASFLRRSPSLPDSTPSAKSPSAEVKPTTPPKESIRADGLSKEPTPLRPGRDPYYNNRQPSSDDVGVPQNSANTPKKWTSKGNAADEPSSLDFESGGKKRKRLKEAFGKLEKEGDNMGDYKFTNGKPDFSVSDPSSKSSLKPSIINKTNYSAAGISGIRGTQSGVERKPPPSAGLSVFDKDAWSKVQPKALDIFRNNKLFQLGAKLLGPPPPEEESGKRKRLKEALKNVKSEGGMPDVSAKSNRDMSGKKVALAGVSPSAAIPVPGLGSLGSAIASGAAALGATAVAKKAADTIKKNIPDPMETKGSPERNRVADSWKRDRQNWERAGGFPRKEFMRGVPEDLMRPSGTFPKPESGKRKRLKEAFGKLEEAESGLTNIANALIKTFGELMPQKGAKQLSPAQQAAKEAEDYFKANPEPSFERSKSSSTPNALVPSTTKPSSDETVHDPKQWKDATGDAALYNKDPEAWLKKMTGEPQKSAQKSVQSQPQAQAQAQPAPQSQPAPQNTTPSQASPSQSQVQKPASPPSQSSPKGQETAKQSPIMPPQSDWNPMASSVPMRFKAQHTSEYPGMPEAPASKPPAPQPTPSTQQPQQPQPQPQPMPQPVPIIGGRTSPMVPIPIFPGTIGSGAKTTPINTNKHGMRNRLEQVIELTNLMNSGDNIFGCAKKLKLPI